MPTPGLGNQSWMQFGKETTPGTPPALMQYRMEIITADVKPDINTIPDPSLYSGQSRRGFFEGAKVYRGTMVMRPTYTGGILEILRGVSGTYSATPVVGDTAVIDHVFKEGPSLNTYTVEFNIGAIPALNTTTGVARVFRLTGCRFSAITFRSTAGNSADAMVQCEITMIATDMVSDQPETVGLTRLTATITVPAAPNNNTVTRGAGSWVTDGVKVGMKITGQGGTAAFPNGHAIVTNVAATTLTLDRAGTAGTFTSIDYYLTYGALNPILFHQAQYVDDGVCNAFPGIAGDITGGTTFTRSAGSNTTDGILVGYHVGGFGVPAGTLVATVAAGSLTTTKAMPNATGVSLSFAAPIRMRSFEITLTNNLTEDRFYMGSPSLDDALRSDFLDATFRLTQEFQDKAAFDAARTFGNALTPRIVFRVPGVTIGTKSNREVEIHADSAQPGEWSTPIEGYGVLLSTMTLNSFNNPADQTAIAFRVRNEDAALPA